MGVRGSAKRRRRRAPSSSAAGASTKGGKSRFPLNRISAAAADGNVLERESKRQRASTLSAAAGCDAAGAGVDDVISGLGDDVLVRILELLPDARDAVRTAALSRRWRGLWTRLPALHFSSGSLPEFLSAGTGSQRYVSFVNDALALRAAQTDPPLHRLEITFIMRGLLLQRCFEAAQGWIRHAGRNEVKSFVLVLHPPIILENKGKKKEQFVMTLDDLPSSAKMETMRLALGGATVRLPAAATFASLADLSLENLEFADGSGRLLNRLLSPVCCPRLRKLSMRNVGFAGVHDLLLEAEALVELTWEGIGCHLLYALRLTTPSLRVLRMVNSYLDDLTLSAPRLEELLFFDSQPISNFDVDGELSCVRSLKFELMSHEPHGDGGQDYDDEDIDNVDYDINRVGIRLLNFCTAATCLDIDLYIAKVRASHPAFFNIVFGIK
ncbi:unnamed protein product [Urochloa decumbens]|uniref:F-box domain-containing protein n=1 Tax=Urochloa decumbens TaxID=240449 RepID=A0ABC9D1Q7_9POAL